MMVIDTTGGTAQTAQDRAQHFTQAIGALELAHAFLGTGIQSLRRKPQDMAFRAGSTDLVAGIAAVWQCRCLAFE